MNVSQLDFDSVAWQKGPRLRMFLKIFPRYVNDSVRLFNRSEVLWIRDMFGGWRIPDSPVFGPYEFLNFTLSELYRDRKFPIQELYSTGCRFIFTCFLKEIFC